MAYEKQEWKDHLIDKITGQIVQKGTILKAERFEHIEDGIVANCKAIESLSQTVDSLEPLSLEELDEMLEEILNR